MRREENKIDFQNDEKRRAKRDSMFLSMLLLLNSEPRRVDVCQTRKPENEFSGWLLDTMCVDLISSNQTGTHLDHQSKDNRTRAHVSSVIVPGETI